MLVSRLGHIFFYRPFICLCMCVFMHAHHHCLLLAHYYHYIYTCPNKSQVNKHAHTRLHTTYMHLFSKQIHIYQKAFVVRMPSHAKFYTCIFVGQNVFKIKLNEFQVLRKKIQNLAYAYSNIQNKNKNISYEFSSRLASSRIPNRAHLIEQNVLTASINTISFNYA